MLMRWCSSLPFSPITNLSGNRETPAQVSMPKTGIWHPSLGPRNTVQGRWWVIRILESEEWSKEKHGPWQRLAYVLVAFGISFICVCKLINKQPVLAWKFYTFMLSYKKWPYIMRYIMVAWIYNQCIRRLLGSAWFKTPLSSNTGETFRQTLTEQKALFLL